MSAEVLRRAAALMRERAEAATEGPWAHYGHSIIRPAEMKDGSAPSYSAAYYKEDGEHIASWHPAVALAVADWLETTAAFPAFDVWARAGASGKSHLCKEIAAALAVATTYLGESS